MKHAVCRPIGSHPRGHPVKLGLALASSLALLSSCTTFGTNIKGSFACGAPEGGTCAPATVIDDRALAEIAGESGDYRPAGPYPASTRSGAPQQIVYAANAPAAVSQTKVLRIVFPAHVDGAGRYHETSVVQASVDNGAWMAATNGHGPGLAATNVLNVSPDVLSQLGGSMPDQVSSADPSGTVRAADPSAPSPQAVAAARVKAKAKGKGTEFASSDRIGLRETVSKATSAPATAPTSSVTGTPSTAAASTGKAPVNRPVSFSPHVDD